jgi:hypothetical protein
MDFDFRFLNEQVSFNKISTGIEQEMNYLPEDLNAIKEGLYIMIYQNNNDEHVLDRNRKPKPIILKKSFSLKSGKFEGGLEGRLKDYYRHLHRKSDPGNSVFQECLMNLFVVETSDILGEEGLITSRVFEQFWNSKIKLKLKEKGYLDEINTNNRSEWIQLKNVEYNQFISEIIELKSKLNENIFRMSEVIVQSNSR